jgi:hypothetical protein
MNARLQRSKIKRIRVEIEVGPESSAGHGDLPAGAKGPKRSKNDGGRATTGYIVIEKPMY